MLSHSRQSATICGVRDITGPDMSSYFIADGNDRALTESRDSVQPRENHAGLQAGVERIGECSGSGFLLDWLAGGEVCKRDIQGFSVRVETLVLMNARRVSEASKADRKPSNARRK